ncbi:methylenetetrahydrofolate--tRNA-(uracil-5-)-methyltransferase [Paucidesulfovibrio gracilis DSM 16080]|uniref:Methylenetetrahydrofolate--tRNA-(uracil-5-)-methyltransferase TrmFO n=1 Tax=Paucidesulfovibrio gracilis DSM 16080 TaxID=1121449 RepID=A0A1T4WV97_9BACT|nr:methylenetetrahydrofolate--tRNA-(uracil(54)-C(5))-methyltransferase (FADH(2)-oxidizing) TrmFO [Paucidesulfovibrio gracilis]SKA80561.1 methylenetetrahydrofolate--tRNA-(uracil-5-)-methyltransferase [Paucidesulfovibrio gracilis DSM 16080]
MSETRNNDMWVAVIGGGLAGCECAYTLSRAGVPVRMFEMKPERFSEAHHNSGLAELVCSNSLRSEEPSTGVGLLKQEMRALHSLVMNVADEVRVPAGKALAVDRERFSSRMTEVVSGEPNIVLVREEIGSLDHASLQGATAVVVAAGPMASESLAEDLQQLVGGERLYFYDAIAPIIASESVDMNKAFWGSRYRPEDTDYLNCPLSEEQYKAFINAMLAAEKVKPREFEQHIHFEGCLPVEEMAERGEMTLAFGPLKPVGLEDPRTGEQPFAVVQLRAENREKTAFNMVGFQTKLTYPEQKRIFRMIPGLENAEFLRLGSIHRNTYVDAPSILDGLELKARPGTYLAGQITGVEGYVESAACGLWLGHLLAARLRGRDLPCPPCETALGGLLAHLGTPPAKRFQPSNVHFGLMPALNRRAPKKKRKELYAARGRDAFAKWLGEVKLFEE